MEPTQSGVKTWQWVVTVIVIIILIIVGIIVFGGKKSSEIPSDTGMSTTTDTVMNGANRIVMSDQFPGDVVNISTVQLDKPGYISINKDDAGKPGAVIGSAHFAAGINTGRITLSQPTVEGGTYYAIIHSDDGDGVFDNVKDAPLTDTNGNVIMRIFHASASANIDVKG